MTTKTKTTEKNGTSSHATTSLESVWVRAFKSESEWPDKVLNSTYFFSLPLLHMDCWPVVTLSVFSSVFNFWITLSLLLTWLVTAVLLHFNCSPKFLNNSLKCVLVAGRVFRRYILGTSVSWHCCRYLVGTTTTERIRSFALVSKIPAWICL